MYKRLLRALIPAAALIAMQGSAFAGQHEQKRDGFWLGIGLGYGSAGVSAEGLDGDGREGGMTLFLKSGGKLGDQLLLGGEINGWTKSSEGATMTLGTGTAALYYYPITDAGLFLKGGVGMSFTSIETLGYEFSRTQSWGLVAGLGYDFRVASNVSITPVANLYFGGPTDMEALGMTVLEGYKFNVFDVGVGVTFH